MEKVEEGRRAGRSRATDETEAGFRGKARLQLLCEAAPLSMGFMPISMSSLPSLSHYLWSLSMACHIPS